MSSNDKQENGAHTDRKKDNQDVILLSTQGCQNELWLVMETLPKFMDRQMEADNDHSHTSHQRGALLSSFQNRDKYIQQLAGTGADFTVKKVSNLVDLRDFLLTTLPASPASSSTSNQEQDSAATGSEKKKDKYYPKGLDEIKRFDMFREMIEHEDDLLNQRVSWIILAQSFLMAAFISAASSIENRSFLYITAAVGLATVVVTMPALFAAGQNIEVQQRVYFLGLESDEQCLRLHGHDRNLKKTQNELFLRKTKGHIFPNTAFRGWFGVPILKTVFALAVVQVAGWCFLLIALIMDW